MLIDKATFKFGNVSEVVSLESITQREDYITVKRNLYCITAHCNCRLTYIPQGRKIAYFKKWKGDRHSESCLYYRETVNNGRSRRILGTTVSRLRDSHANSILKGLYNIYSESEEEKKARLLKSREYARNRKNKVIEPQNKMYFDEIILNQPSTSLNIGPLQEGERNPPVRRRVSLLDFDLADIGYTMATIGYLRELKIKDRYAVMSLSDKKKLITFNIYLEEAFYSNSFFNINSMLEGLGELLHKDGMEIIVSCIGEVVLREGEFGMIIMDISKLNFNRLPLSALLINSNTLFSNRF